MTKLKIEMIEIGQRRRALNPDKVKELAESMRTVGQITPIAVYTKSPDHVHTAVLWAGHHRLEAARQLGWKEIEVVFVSGDEVKRQLVEIAENVHRNDLSTEERNKHIAAWVDILKKQEEEKEAAAKEAEEQKPKGKRGRPKGSKNGEKTAHAGPKTPNKRGRPKGSTKTTSARSLAKQMGVSRQKVQRATKAASVTPEAEEAAKAAGIVSQQDMIKVAEAPPEQQAEKVAEIAAAQERRRPSPNHMGCSPTSTRRLPCSRAAPPARPHPSVPADTAMRTLMPSTTS